MTRTPNTGRREFDADPLRFIHMTIPEREAYVRLVKDAQRYRWIRAIPAELRADHDENLREGGWDAPMHWPGECLPGRDLQGTALDAAIDTTIASQLAHTVDIDLLALNAMKSCWDIAESAAELPRAQARAKMQCVIAEALHAALGKDGA